MAPTVACEGMARVGLDGRLRGGGMLASPTERNQVHQGGMVGWATWPWPGRRARRPLGVTMAGQRERVEEGSQGVV